MSLITYLTRIHFADRVLEDALAEEIARRGIRRPLLLCDMEAAGGEALDRVTDALPVEAQPRRHVVNSAEPMADLSAARTVLGEAQCDGILGLGGMRPLDLARVLGSRDLPVITIPTGPETVGLGPLGAAAARAAPRSPTLPAAILCDATLTLETEGEALAAAGMDALVHCLESYLSIAYNPPADGIALDGVRRAARNIEEAVAGADRLAPRRELLAAALDAGLAAQKGVGGVEAAAHGLEASAETRHGALHAALLRAVLSFNAPAIGDRLTDLERALDLPAGADIAAALARLAGRIGLPLRLSEAGIAASALAEAARRAAADPANRTNPRHATSADYERIMQAAL
jgi:alcohol dehydrogenase class IV